MTFQEAAMEVLRRVGKPLSSQKIAQLAVKHNLLTVVGKTPEATMASRLDVATRDQYAPDSPFVKMDKSGTYALREWGGNPPGPSAGSGFDDLETERRGGGGGEGERADRGERGASDRGGRGGGERAERGASDRGGRGGGGGGGERAERGGSAGADGGASAGGPRGEDREAGRGKRRRRGGRGKGGRGEVVPAAATPANGGAPLPEAEADGGDAGDAGDAPLDSDATQPGANGARAAADDHDGSRRGRRGRRGGRRRRGRGAEAGSGAPVPQHGGGGAPALAPAPSAGPAGVPGGGGAALGARAGGLRSEGAPSLGQLGLASTGMGGNGAPPVAGPRTSPAFPAAAAPGAPAPDVPAGAARIPSLVDAAYAVMRGAGARAPLHFHRIAELGRAAGLRASGPAIHAAILADNERRAARGLLPLFAPGATGEWALSEWALPERVVRLEQRLFELTREMRMATQEEISEQLRAFDPAAFQQLMALLLERQGYGDIRLASRSSEGNVALVATLHHGLARIGTALVLRTGGGVVSREHVRDLRARLGQLSATQGVILSVPGVAPDARAEGDAPGPPIRLLDADEIAELLVSVRLGVRLGQVTVVRPDIDFFTELRRR